ncbi:hypothetical protein VNO77_03921 [Canavalia gladiata]|uniref:Uncharacterized protein n=1 Tax=Canavalia gladiata TaxID=3824 RepID=A0AAN9R7A3_CANGL
MAASSLEVLGFWLLIEKYPRTILLAAQRISALVGIQVVVVIIAFLGNVRCFYYSRALSCVLVKTLIPLQNSLCHHGYWEGHSFSTARLRNEKDEPEMMKRHLNIVFISHVDARIALSICTLEQRSQTAPLEVLHNSPVKKKVRYPSYHSLLYADTPPVTLQENALWWGSYVILGFKHRNEILHRGMIFWKKK